MVEHTLRAGSPSPATAPTSAFAARLNRLFEVVRTPEGRRYTNDAVIAAIRGKGGPTISRGYLSELRSGKKDNPTLRHITALADFFQVDPAVLVSDGTRSQAEGTQRPADPVLVQLVVRLGQLSPAQLDLIDAVMDVVERLRANA